MKALLRIVAASALLALAACGQPTRTAQPPAGGQAGDAPVVLATTRNMPDWLLVARQRDCPANAPAAQQCPLGEVHFNQRTITRNADGIADIWVQASHGQPQLYEFETADTTTTVRFTLERLHYRFNCNTSQFVVVERQIMGAGETVVAHEAPRQIWRAPAPGSITIIVMPIACRGG
jgi:Surface-adhesin protein E